MPIKSGLLNDAALNQLLNIVTICVTAFIAWRVEKRANKSDRKVQEVNAKTDQVHVLVNENFNKSQSALGVANEKIIGLEHMVSQLLASIKSAETGAVLNALSQSVPASSVNVERKAQQSEPVDVAIVSLPKGTETGA